MCKHIEPCSHSVQHIGGAAETHGHSERREVVVVHSSYVGTELIL